MFAYFISIAVSTYEDVMHGIASKKYLAGVMNTDVVHHYLEHMRNEDHQLRVVYQVPHEDPIMTLFPLITRDAYTQLDYCFNNLTYSTITAPTSKFRGYIKVSTFSYLVVIFHSFNCITASL